MESHGFLFNTVIYLLAAVIFVPVSKRLGLGSVLGYLVAGVIIGPWCLKIINHVEDILHFSEFGVVLLLFLIGLELNPERLWALRKPMLGMGSLQVIVTSIILTGIGLFMGFDLHIALIAGMGLSLSSTAMALQTLTEKNLLSTNAGGSAFSVLLFQDIAVIFMIAFLPLLGNDPSAHQDRNIALASAKAIGVILAIVVGGRFLLRPVFRVIADTNIREIFTAFSLLIVIGISLLMQAVDMSMALGAFLAGVLLAESEYRLELEIDIEPFKGLLIGLFFISVGMSLNIGLLGEKTSLIVTMVAGIVLVKFLILFALGKIFKMKSGENFIFSFIISQGGEFAFVLFTIASQTFLLPKDIFDTLIVVVGISMATTPLLMFLNDKFIQPRFSRPKITPEEMFEAEKNPVIIVGFGRFGQVVGRLLHCNRIGTTILDHNPNQIESAGKYGYKVFYGDATRVELLKTAGADNAKLMILALDDPEMIIEVVKVVKEHFPHLTLLARAANRTRAFELINSGVKTFCLETFHSALLLGEGALRELGFGAYQAKKKAGKFRDHDIKTLYDQLPFHQDEVKRISLAKEARKELEELFQSDERVIIEERDSSWG